MRWTTILTRLRWLLQRRRPRHVAHFSAGRAKVDEAAHSTTRVVPRGQR